MGSGHAWSVLTLICFDTELSKRGRNNLWDTNVADCSSSSFGVIFSPFFFDPSDIYWPVIVRWKKKRLASGKQLTHRATLLRDIYGRRNGSLWFVWHGGKYLEGFRLSLHQPLEAYIPTRYSKTMIVSYYPLPGLYYSSASLYLFLLLKILLFFIYARELLLVDTHNLSVYPPHL